MAKLSRLAVVGSAAVVSVGAVLGLAGLSPSVRHQAALSFTHQPERFTALHVTDPAQLPANVQSGQPGQPGRPGRPGQLGQPVWADFSIDNREGRARRYSYVATLTASELPTVTTRGTVTIADGGQARQRIALRIPPSAPSAADYWVTVRLERTGETIRYRVGPALSNSGGAK